VDQSSFFRSEHVGKRRQDDGNLGILSFSMQYLMMFIFLGVK
jgi:hypothetical protein